MISIMDSFSERRSPKFVR